ncbi:MAG TPA: dTDP-4-dehydrorhamnose reductase [Planctomycetota bacterium]|nr:dTDP-4-dehydrorhamnose reductase [Planctomycetota bacterium]
MKIAVLGAGGLLGRTFDALARAGGHETLALSRRDCDVADEAAVARALEAFRPAALVNGAAYTDVDRAEKDMEACFRTNAVGPGALARAAETLGARLVHVSTDYVFDGEKGAPYVESDPTNPRGVYAISKLEGERAALAASPRAIVARTAWLYGPGGKNFVSKMPEILREKGEMGAVADQWSSPTRADELAKALLAMLAREVPGGLYHVSATGKASYHEVALEAARALGIAPEKVRPTEARALVRPAPRPRATPLASEKLPALGIALRDWREAYREFALASAR